MSVTQFKKHADLAVSTVGAGGKAIGAATFGVETGEGDFFAAGPGRLALVQAGGWDPDTGQITDRTKKAVYTYSTRAGDTFSGVAVQAGQTDLAFAAGDLVLDAVDWQDMAEVQDAINALEAAGGGGGTPGGGDTQVQVNAAGAFEGLPEFTYRQGTTGLTLAPIWDDAAETFSGIRIDITNTASNAGSSPLTISVNGAAKATFDTSGSLMMNNLLIAAEFKVPTEGADLQQAGLLGSKDFLLGWSSTTIYSNTPETTLGRVGPGVLGFSGARGEATMAVQTPATGGTIAVQAAGLYVGQVPIAPAAAITGAILATGMAAMEVTVINRSAFSVTFAASGSNVSTGSACVIAAGTAKKFQWDAGSSLWYPHS